MMKVAKMAPPAEMPEASPAPEEDPEEEEAPAEDAEAGEEEDKPAEHNIQRDEDMPLEDVAEDMREAVEGNLALKRVLSDSVTTGNAQKKQKTVGGITPVGISPALPAFKKTKDPEKVALMNKWMLQADAAAWYVIDSATEDGIEHLKKTNFTPSKFHDRKSCSEQINEALLRFKESRGPPGGALDVIVSFKYRWGLQLEEEKKLRELTHKDLRHVLAEYDGTRPLEEIVSEASLLEAEEDSVLATDAAPLKPGPLTMGRFNRLELVDPMGDTLVVGDANLTFSLELAEHRKGLGHTGRTIATTFENYETLKERYPEIDGTIGKLEECYAEVLHNVDCTRLATDTRFVGMEKKFGAAYYNFPHAGVIGGFFDGNPMVRWRHENLMHLFFRALRGFMKEGGIVKVTSNAGAVGVRYSDIMDAAYQSEFVHVETFPLMEWCLRHYHRSYGDRRDVTRRPEKGNNYNSQGASVDMVYTFVYAPSGEAVNKPRIRMPPTKQHLVNSKDGSLGNMIGAGKEARVEEIYKIFLQYVQGIHVG